MPGLNPDYADAATRPAQVAKASRVSDTISPTHLLAYYSPSVYSAPGGRYSAITLFEEDTRPIGLGV
jgi:hypothetical protein